MTDLSYLADGWLELESDPGLFTLLIEDFGCKNVQVDEIYDLSKVGLIDGQVYGFIFLFKWTEERRSRNRSQMILSTNNQLTNRDQQEPYYVEDENLVNSIFFAHQITPNSCATHALLSVLLNCDRIHLGENLNRLKELTNSMDPESKGFAIGNMPELARAHNLHASEIDGQEKRNKQSQANKSNGFPRQIFQGSGDSFHFISFVNINNRVYELDGLKKYPIDHGPIGENETFSEKFRCIILERIPQQQRKENKLNSQLRKLQTDMNTQMNEEIRYSLMAVVPDRRKENLKRLKFLKSKRSILLGIIQNLAKRPKLPEPYEIHSYSKYTTTLSENRPLEVNVNKLVVKDINYNSHQLNSSNIINNAISLNIKDNQSNNVSQDDKFDDDSTDTCSDCESKLSDGESCDEDDKIHSFYAFKFMPLKKQNNDKKNDMIDDTKYKTFSESELIEFYKDYGFQDLINILKKIEIEINLCNRTLNEENEKRTKFYVDDSRRTHNYNDFITTYLLMITEQKKLHQFIESKESKPSVTNDMINEQQMDEDTPIKFFKEILTNYEDVLIKNECESMADTESLIMNESTNSSIKFIDTPVYKLSNNNPSINIFANKSMNKSPDIVNSSPVSCNQSINDNDNLSRRIKYPRRASKPKSNIGLISGNVKRKEKTK